MKKFYNNFIASIKKGILQTFTFSGKSNRFEFATYFITTSVAYYAFTILLVTKFEEFYVSFVGLWIILAIILGISQLANTVRRLNYLGDGMWLLILVLIPILNLLFIVYLCVGSSESEIKSDT
jgi:uncharacterized membrane protein YhaH (DUF805 family)